MKEYAVKTAFVFESFFFVRAENEQQAQQIVCENCGLVMGGKIHSSLSDDEVDWDFNTHPETKIIKVKQFTERS
jgi:transcription initiation factor TFIIIB Brf1 subunit/transcription initiation factor TFIIB